MIPRPVLGNPTKNRIPTEALIYDSDGALVNILLHVIDGYINELEIIRADGEPLNREIDAGHIVPIVNEKQNTFNTESSANHITILRQHVSKKHPKRTLVGIHGWLRFFVVVYVIGVALLPIGLWAMVQNYYDISHAASTPLSGLLPLTIFDISLSLVIGGFSIWLLIPLFRKKKNLPHYMILFNIIGTIAAMADCVLWLYWGSTEGMSYVAHDLLSQHQITYFFCLIAIPVSAGVWCLYLMSSKRVKVTFVK